MDCDNLPHVYICVLYKAETRAMGLSCCAGIRATVSALLWLCPAKKDRSAPTGIQKAWRTVAIAARVALPLIVLNWFGMPAFAQDATWLSTPSTSVFNTPSNWIGGVVPTGTATFNTSSQTNITFLAPPFTATVQTLMFNAPGYTFALAFPPELLITGSGIAASQATNFPTFNIPDGDLHFINMSTAGPAFINVSNLGNVTFNLEDRSTSSSANAGSATITAGVPGNNDDFSGGFVEFYGNSTAENATITAYVGSNIEFHDASSAGSATLTAGNATVPAGAGDNGFIFFDDTSTADHATIMVNPGGELDFSPIFPGCGCTGGTTTAGNATITNNGITGFYQGSSAGNATITTNAGGVTSFFGMSTGGNAAFITNAGGIVDFSGLGTFPDTGAPPDPSITGTTAGSIAGAGTFDLGSKQLTVGSNNLSTTVSGTINDGGLAVPDATGGSLVKVGTGTLTLTGVNTYTGGTTISQGAIAVSADNGLGASTGPLTFNGGTLQFDSSFDLSPSRVITLNAASGGFAGGGTFDTNGFTTTISQVMLGTGGLTKAGAGTLLLANDNTYTGGTTVSLGTLQLGNGGTTGSILGDVSDNGTLAFNRSDVVTFPGLISGTGNVTQIGPGTTILTADSTYAGGTTISLGTLQLGNGGTSGSIVGDVTDNGTLAFNRSDAVTFAGVISGTGSVAQIGPGTTILTADNTYTGGTAISLGTLQLGNGGTSGSILGDVTDNGTLAFDRSDVVTFPGVISGIGSVAQIGPGVTILNADNPYAGVTTVNAGTLVVGDPDHPAAALSGGGSISVAPGATLGGYGSVTGSVTNNGTVAAGNATPGFATAAAGTFTINGDLLNQNLVALTPDPAVGNVLLVRGNYAAGASGTLLVSTVLNAGGALSNQFTDRLLVLGNASGTTSVRIVNAGGSGAITSFTGIPDPADGISVVQVAGMSTPGAFTLPGGYVTGGTPFQYNLYAYGPGSPNGNAEPAQSLVGAGNWDYRLQTVYVSPGGPEPPQPEPPIPTTPTPPPPPDPLPEPGPPAPPLPPDVRPEVAPQVPAYLTAPTALFNAGFQDLDSLHRRLGEIHDDQILGLNPQGEVFLRGFGTTFNYTSDRSFTAFGFNSSGDYAGTQLGGNWIAANNAAGTLRLGLDGTLGRLRYQPSAIDGQSKGLFNTDTLAGTITWQSQQGWYVDAIIMGGMFDGAVSTPNRGQTAGFNGTSIAASLEAGYPIPLGWQRLSLEPEVQLVYQHLNFPQRTDVDGINVDLGSPDQGVFRGGARLIRSFTGPDGRLLTPYLEANVLQGIGGGNNVELSNVGFGTGRFGTALQVGGGITGTLTRNLSVYGDVAWQQNVGNDGGFRGWSFNGGLRFTFGAVAVAVAAVPTAAPAPAIVRTYLVFFDWDRADLTDRARQIIAEAAAASTRVQLTRIQVNGYTDTSGTPRYNQGLSLRRAQAVAAELVRDGVPRSAIAIQGFGETHLLVPTGPGVREPQNRRVEIVIR